MSDNKKGLESLDLETKIKELETINLLHEEFGDVAFRSVEKYYVYSGYITGMDRLSSLVKSGEFDAKTFWDDPVMAIEIFLRGYFVERGGNMPEIWSENRTVYLKTAYCKFCVTIEAEAHAPKCHNDVCYIYCRAFAKGMVKVLEEFFPGLIINFYNKSSRRDGEGMDCVEAFQIVTP